MKYLFTLLACLTTQFAVAQTIPTRPNAYDADSLKTGDWVYYYDADWNDINQPDSAAFYRLIRYEKGKPIGEMGDYYANGKPQMIGTMVEEYPREVYEGVSTFYSENGMVTQIWFYKEKGIFDYKKSIQLRRALQANLSEDQKSTLTMPLSCTTWRVCTNTLDVIPRPNHFINKP